MAFEARLEKGGESCWKMDTKTSGLACTFATRRVRLFCPAQVWNTDWTRPRPDWTSCPLRISQATQAESWVTLNLSLNGQETVGLDIKTSLQGDMFGKIVWFTHCRFTQLSCLFVKWQLKTNTSAENRAACKMWIKWAYLCGEERLKHVLVTSVTLGLQQSPRS